MTLLVPLLSRTDLCLHATKTQWITTCETAYTLADASKEQAALITDLPPPLASAIIFSLHPLAPMMSRLPYIPQDYY